MNEFTEPSKLSAALMELIALRGYARVEEHRRYHAAWKAVANADWAARTKVSRVSRGQMLIEVDNGPLLSELTSFHAAELLQRLQQNYPQLKIKGLKFRLNGFA